jgi:hypothetical protein
MTQSGGLNQGFRNDEYQKRTRGWLGDGALEALNARGKMTALAAAAAAAVPGIRSSGLIAFPSS